MKHNTSASVAYDMAQRKFDQANAAHSAMMNKYFPSSEPAASEPIKMPTVPSLMAFDEIVETIERLKVAEQRLSRAVKAYQWERGTNGGPVRRTIATST